MIVRHPGDPGNPYTDKESGKFYKVNFNIHYPRVLKIQLQNKGNGSF